MGFLGSSVVKNPPAHVEYVGSIPGSGRFHGKGNGNPFQYSCMGNLMEKGAWEATVHGIAKDLGTTLWLNNSNWNYGGDDCTSHDRNS